MRHAAPTAGTALRVNLLGRLEARTRDDRLDPVVRPPRPGALRPAGAVEAAALARGHRRRPVARLGRHLVRRPAPGPVARPPRAEPGRRGSRTPSSRSSPTRSGIRPTATVDLDTTAFETCLDGPGCTLDTALALYRGDLVEGLGHDCFAAERERLSDRFEDALASVAVADLAAGDHEGARRAAERLLVRDPLREEVHAVLIEIYGLYGTRSQVVRQYRRLCTVLDRELDETPLPETEAIYRLALSRTVDRSLARAVTLDPVAAPPGRPWSSRADRALARAIGARRNPAPRRGRLGSHGRMPIHTRSLRMSTVRAPRHRRPRPRRRRRRRLQLERRRQPGRLAPRPTERLARPAADRPGLERAGDRRGPRSRPPGHPAAAGDRRPGRGPRRGHGRHGRGGRVVGRQPRLPGARA